MSVVDLKTRLTSDYDKYQNNIRSSDSYVLIDNNGSSVDSLMSDGPTSIELTVGNRCFLHRKDKFFTIATDGIALKPGQSMLIETAQKIATPLNVFGIITGKGRHIFSGIFLSTGKIDPGFDDRLKIGIYNGGPKAITLKPGDALCTCIFLQTESSLFNKTPNNSRMIQPTQVLLSNWKLLINWVDTNKGWLSLALSTVALIISTTIGIANYYKKPTIQKETQKVLPDTTSHKSQTLNTGK
jgi:deoxycytidine triphosphate deaminase